MALAADGDSTGPTSLTVDEARKSVFETLLSDEPEYRDDSSTTPPAQEKTPEPVQSETDEVEADPEPVQSDEDKSPEQEDPDEEGQDAPQTGVDANTKFRVKVDGKDEEVTLDELTKGYSRTADYTRKTQELAGHRKALEAETVAARTERAQYNDQLKVLAEAIDQVRPREPDWDTLRVQHPSEFPRVWAEWQQGEKDRAELGRMQAEAQRKVDEDNQRLRSERVSAEREILLEKVPEWKDAEVIKRESNEIKAFAEKMGYTAEELAGIEDHRALVMLRNAMLYDKSKAKAAQAVKRIETVRTATPGTGTSRPPVSDQTRALQRLAKTRSQDSLAGVFETMID